MGQLAVGEVESACFRERVLVLVPHEPTLDPRVHYTAQSLGKRYRVTMVATLQESEQRPPENDPPNATYVTKRVPDCKWVSVFGMTSTLVGLWLDKWRGRRQINTVLGVVATVIGVTVAAPVALMGLVAPAAIRRAFLVARWSLAEDRPRWVRSIAGVARSGWRGLKAAVRRTPAKQSSLIQAMAGIRRIGSVLWYTLRVNALLWARSRRDGLVPDIVYCHDLYALQAGVMLKRRYGARLVYDSHEFYPYQYQDWGYAAVIRWYESVLVRAVDRYITVSPHLAEELRRLYGVSSVAVIPNVEPHPALEHLRVASEMQVLAKGRLKLLYQGTFAQGRGLEEVIEEWAHLDGEKVALFLRGPRNSWLDQLGQRAKELGLLGRSVYVLSPVLERDLIARAREADVGLIPYRGEWLSYRFACPNKLSQYLHAGLAILTNRLLYLEEVVGRGQVGLCYDVGVPGSFARAVETLLADPALVERFRQNAAVFARREYNWERYEAMLLDLVGRP